MNGIRRKLFFGNTFLSSKDLFITYCLQNPRKLIIVHRYLALFIILLFNLKTELNKILVLYDEVWQVVLSLLLISSFLLPFLTIAVCGAMERSMV